MNNCKESDRKEQKFLALFEKCFKDVLDLSDIQELIPYVTNVDLSITSKGQVENIKKLLNEINKLYDKLEYLIYSSIIMLSKVYFGNLIKKINYKRELKWYKKELHCVVNFKRVLSYKLNNIANQIENEV